MREPVSRKKKRMIKKYMQNQPLASICINTVKYTFTHMYTHAFNTHLCTHVHTYTHMHNALIQTHAQYTNAEYTHTIVVEEIMIF